MNEPFCPAGSCPFRDECVGVNRTALAAMIYAAHGYAVYPASQWSPAQHHSIGPLPRGEGGWKLATADVDTVRERWVEQWAEPDVNVGLATGRISRLVVVDIDEPTPEMKPGASYGEMMTSTVAADAVRKWASESGVLLPGNAVVSSPGVGRQQVWVRIPADSRFMEVEVPRRQGWLAHVDLLWDKQMVKAPPSVRADTGRKVGGTYRFTTGCPCQVPDADDALLQAMVDTVPVGLGNSGGRSDGDPDEHERVDVEGMIAEGLPVHEQNPGLYRLACSFAAKRKPPSEALAAMAATVARSPVGDPNWPWTLDDLQDLVERAYDFIARDRQTWIDLASKIRWEPSRER